MSETRAQYGGRLREVADRMQGNKPLGVYAPYTLQLAADEITRLRAENERLRAELENIACADPRQWHEETRDQFQQWAQSRARAALAKATAAPAAERPSRPLFCPRCGSGWWATSDTREVSDPARHRVYCKDQHATGCLWRGVRSQLTAAAPAAEREGE